MSGVKQTRRKYVCLLHTTLDIYMVNIMLLSDSRQCLFNSCRSFISRPHELPNLTLPPNPPSSNYMAEYFNFRSNNISMLVSLSHSRTYITYFISYLFFCGDWVVLLKAIICRIIIQGMQSLIS